MLPHPQEPLQLPRWWELPTEVNPQWSSCYALRGIERFELVYSSLRGRSWDCSHLLQLSRTPRPHRPLALGIPVRSPMVPVEARGKSSLLHSLSLLFQLLASQDADSAAALHWHVPYLTRCETMVVILLQWPPHLPWRFIPGVQICAYRESLVLARHDA